MKQSEKREIIKNYEEKFIAKVKDDVYKDELIKEFHEFMIYNFRISSRPHGDIYWNYMIEKAEDYLNHSMDEVREELLKDRFFDDLLQLWGELYSICAIKFKTGSVEVDLMQLMQRYKEDLNNVREFNKNKASFKCKVSITLPKSNNSTWSPDSF